MPARAIIKLRPKNGLRIGTAALPVDAIAKLDKVLFGVPVVYTGLPEPLAIILPVGLSVVPVAALLFKACV
jgi:hypothetical protein